MSDLPAEGPKVTLNAPEPKMQVAPPSQRRATTLVDARGRRLTLRDLTVLDQVRLLRAIGPAQSANEPYVNIVNVCASVADIDGDVMPFPSNEREIDALVRMIGDAGFAAIGVEIKRQIDEVHAAAEAAAKGAERPADPFK